ncbi:hypothetical protein T439DRAFT_335445 [Meredithblackwellia eburnea MCA 4105]
MIHVDNQGAFIVLNNDDFVAVLSVCLSKESGQSTRYGSSGLYKGRKPKSGVRTTRFKCRGGLSTSAGGASGTAALGRRVDVLALHLNVQHGTTLNSLNFYHIFICVHLTFVYILLWNTTNNWMGKSGSLDICGRQGTDLRRMLRDGLQKNLIQFPFQLRQFGLGKFMRAKQAAAVASESAQAEFEPIFLGVH